MLGVFKIGTLQVRLSTVNRQRTNSTGGELAEEVTGVHLPGQGASSVNTIFYANGIIGQSPTRILLDSGAAVSVVCYKFLTDEHRQQLLKSVGAVGATTRCCRKDDIDNIFGICSCSYADWLE